MLSHSFGGAILIKSLCHVLSTVYSQEVYDKIHGLIVIDVVERSAMETMPYMRSAVESRKNNFSAINKAIEYMSTMKIRSVCNKCESKCASFTT